MSDGCLQQRIEIKRNVGAGIFEWREREKMQLSFCLATFIHSYFLSVFGRVSRACLAQMSLSSMVATLRELASAASACAPEPAKGSSTRPPGRLYACNSGSNTRNGFAFG